MLSLFYSFNSFLIGMPLLSVSHIQDKIVLRNESELTRLHHCKTTRPNNCLISIKVGSPELHFCGGVGGRYSNCACDMGGSKRAEMSGGGLSE